MSANHINGLTLAEVKERIASGKVNSDSGLKTKSIKRIFYDNICTLFNLINVILFAALILVGSYKNLLFIGVVLFNTAIGIIQEIRSKQSVDKLTILSESKTEAMRDGKIVKINKNEIVLDDIIILSRGNQIPADCLVYSGSCKVNESLLTGESNLVEKSEGDELLSGSFVSAGKCFAKVTKIGDECYAAIINNEAKYIKKNNSQILKSFKFIIKICSFIIFPLGAMLFISQFLIHHNGMQTAVVSTVAALVGMIPSGMILLTSTVLAVSVIRLSSKKVLVNEMHCIESLARVDVICLDKTGTLTTDEMTVTDVIVFDSNVEEIKTALSSIAEASVEVNATVRAVLDYTKDVVAKKCIEFVPFLSETKWSGGRFDNGKSYFMGAAEFLFSDKEKYSDVFKKIDSIGQTVRIIALAESDVDSLNQKLPDNLSPMALILIKDKLRENVTETVRFFKEQGVELKVISGDSVKTVQNIAFDTGIEGSENAVDMTTIQTDEELFEAAQRCSVFGRVTPAQKKQLVLALKNQGHFVAMTGDGVNDVLALKEADCSIAMASGSEAARNTSQLVLINNDFGSMPGVVAEGRRTINNIERSSSLYLVKTIYSMVLALFFVFFGMRYPFEPIQLSFIGALTIGFPSFVLALQPNKNRIEGNFTLNIIVRAAPAAICIILNIIITALLSVWLNVSVSEVSTISVYLTAISSLLLIIRLSIPFNPLRAGMLALSVGGLTLGSIFFGQLFSLSALSGESLLLLLILAFITVVLFNVLYNLACKIINKH